MKRTAIARKTPLRSNGKGLARAIKPKRAKARPGRLKGAALTALRNECFLRDRGLCQHCGKKTNPELDPIFAESMHMAHIKAKRNGGDSLDNVRTLCGSCHRDSHNFGPSMTKPVPPKGAAPNGLNRK